jgi:GTP diphosphokinase / guanosine-3',5'-bis(diphosphate) 3'-diphosphatase
MLRKVREILESAKDRESFLKIIASIFPTRDYRYQLIEKAYDDGKDAFRGKSRENGERYFEHLRAVALIVILYLRIKDYRVIAASLLHDNVEDLPHWTIARIAMEYDSEIALLVESVSKPKDTFPDRDECHAVYHDILTRVSREAIFIKLADRLHNLLTLWSCSKEKRLRKIKETKKHYLPLAEKHFILYHELLAVIEELEAGG